MKNLKWLGLGMFVFMLCGCVPPAQDVQNLKVRIANLELLVQQQNQEINNLKKDLGQFKKEIEALEKGTIENATLSVKTQILADIEELKNEQAQLSSQLEELHFKSEEREKELVTDLQQLRLEIQALQLRLKELEAKIAEEKVIKQKESSKKEEILGNQTRNIVLSNQTEVKKEENKTQEAISKKGSNKTEASENATEVGLKKEEKEKQQSEQLEKISPLSEAELYQEAYASYRKGDYDRARRLFEEYVSRFPEGKWIGQAYYWIGETYFKQKDYEEAILAYQKLIDLPGWHPQKPSAMLKQAKAFLELGDKEAAKIILKKLIKEYPNTPQAVEARNLLSE